MLNQAKRACFNVMFKKMIGSFLDIFFLKSMFRVKNRFENFATQFFHGKWFCMRMQTQVLKTSSVAPKNRKTYSLWRLFDILILLQPTTCWNDTFLFGKTFNNDLKSNAVQIKETKDKHWIYRIDYFFFFRKK